MSTEAQEADNFTHDQNPEDHHEAATRAESHETDEGKKLNEALELIAEIAQKGERSSSGVDSAAEAAYLIRNSILTLPFRMAWDGLPAIAQREFAGADPSTVGAFLTRYLPFLNPRTFFAPGLLIAVFAKLGILKFKMNSSEEAAMKKSLGENPSETAKAAFKLANESEIINKIIIPGAGLPDLVNGSLGQAAVALEPELEVVAATGQGLEKLQDARDAYLNQIRERVQALELADIQAKEAAQQVVPNTAAEEHNAVAAADPQANITPLAANNTSTSAFDTEEHESREAA